WTIQFTNPVGMVTEAMGRVLGDRVIGICDSPVGLFRRVAWLLGVPADRVWFDYAGLNHLGWLTAARVGGQAWLAGLLADPAALARIEEGRLFGPDWLAALGAIPNENLFYYYATREAIAAVRTRGSTRGEYLAGQQEAFYAAVAQADPGGAPGWAAAEWARGPAQRGATCLPEARPAPPAAADDPTSSSGSVPSVSPGSSGVPKPFGEPGDPSGKPEPSGDPTSSGSPGEPSGGGYEQVALAVL